MDEQRPSASYNAALWLIAVGLVLVGYGAWERWGTNVVAWHNQREAVADLTDGWRDPDDAKIGQAMALLRIPALGADYEVPIVEGVNSDDLSRGVGHYPGTTGYSPIELVRSVFAGSTQHITRPVISSDDGRESYDHKGFNWRVLRTLVRAEFELVRESTSPVEWLGPQLGTQRWLIARKRGADAETSQERVA